MSTITAKSPLLCMEASWVNPLIDFLISIKVLQAICQEGLRLTVASHDCLLLVTSSCVVKIIGKLLHIMTSFSLPRDATIQELQVVMHCLKWMFCFYKLNTHTPAGTYQKKHKYTCVNTYTHVPTHAHTHTHARAHARTHTHTHTKEAVLE